MPIYKCIKSRSAICVEFIFTGSLNSHLAHALIPKKLFLLSDIQSYTSKNQGRIIPPHFNSILAYSPKWLLGEQKKRLNYCSSVDCSIQNIKEAFNQQKRTLNQYIIIVFILLIGNLRFFPCNLRQIVLLEYIIFYIHIMFCL